jgi:2-polyprenyl-3-methyl-5-hydroxy-6-metoxy-1,4-benzoquinol methylase
MKEQQTSHMSALDIRCHVCGESAVDMVPGYEMFRGVTSDCRLWHKGGRLCVCRVCGCVQKVTDHVWQSEVNKIYQAYSIYHQSGGAEQAVFGVASGRASSRSERLLECLYSHLQLPETGCLLDVGCGNGALIRAFSRFAPLWSLAGTELNDKYRLVVESIDNVRALYTCPPDQVPGTYTLITMIHVLEHVLAPKEFIVRLKDKLEDGGLLVVEVPEFLQNPFDLLIVDHCTHFTVATAAELIQSAGYEVILVTTDWVPKELTIVARKAGYCQMNRADHMSSLSFESAVRCLQWLKSVIVAARQISANGTFGLFGTSIAGTWLFGELEESVSFFVDEDLNRAGKTHMGLPIYHPRDVPRGSHVFIALPTRLAENIQARMAASKYGFNCYLPPPLLT